MRDVGNEDNGRQYVMHKLWLADFVRGLVNAFTIAIDPDAGMDPSILRDSF